MQKSLRDYPLMKIDEIVPWLQPMIDEEVSEVARSSRGFLFHYMKHGPKMLKDLSITPSGNYGSIEWWQKRQNFIKRHLAQYKKNKTFRRKLALIAWAYIPKD